MTYEQDMAVRQKCWYRDGVEEGRKEGMATQKAEDEKIIQEIVNEKNAEIARILEENTRMKALLEAKKD